MTEAQISFLCKIASTLFTENETHNLLRSHYLLRCKKIARGNNLPESEFSSIKRCSHCCLEWKKGTNIHLKSIKLSKSQRKRIKRLKNSHKSSFDKKILLHANKMEQICSFCGHNTIKHLKKPDNPLTEIKRDKNELKPLQENMIKRQDKKPENKIKKKVEKIAQIKDNTKINRNLETNVYSKAYEVFSLNNKANILPNTVKELPKVIKNNKRKRDKFAGLCEKAVLASSKFKQEQQKQNKLNLFLKPSS